MSNITAETNDDVSHNNFDLLNFILAQKLTILEGGLHWWPFCNFISNNEMSKTIKKTNDNFSQDHFDVLNFKLTILEGGLYWWPFCNFCFSILKCLILLQKQLMIFLMIILSY